MRLLQQDTTDDWRRALLIGLSAVLAVALVVGGVVSAVALGAAKFMGVGSEAPSAAPPAPSVHIPPDSEGAATPSTDDPESGGTTAAAEVEPDERQTDTERGGGKDRAKQDRKRAGLLTLSASPTQARAFQRVRLTGRYPGGHGTTLVVQRREGGRWVRFPTTATVRGGGFRTWVQSGHRGRNLFRVVDRDTGRTSDPVLVRIR